MIIKIGLRLTFILLACTYIYYYHLSPRKCDKFYPAQGQRDRFVTLEILFMAKWSNFVTIQFHIATSGELG